MLNSKGDILRLDRLIIKGNHAIVVDYKTTIDQLNEHKEQVSCYMSALKTTGFKQVNGYILYVSDLKLVEV